MVKGTVLNICLILSIGIIISFIIPTHNIYGYKDNIKENITSSIPFSIPFNSHFAIQIPNEKTYSSNTIPFP